MAGTQELTGCRGCSFCSVYGGLSCDADIYHMHADLSVWCAGLSMRVGLGIKFGVVKTGGKTGGFYHPCAVDRTLKSNY